MGKAAILFAFLLGGQGLISLPFAQEAATGGPSAFSTATSSEEWKAFLQEETRSGNGLYVTGRTMFLGGGLLVMTSSLPDLRSLQAAGRLILGAGLPLMGAGADRLQRAARIANPDAVDKGRMGWPFYWSSVGFLLAGAVAWETTLLLAEDATHGYPTTGQYVGMATTFGLVAASSTFFIASWYQFSKRREAANRSLVPYALLPRLLPGSDGALIPGAALAWRF